MLTQTPTPETELERTICGDADWISGMQWGKPRPGHPEGAVGLHTIDVLDNVDRFACDAAERHDLRLVALLHDACKAATHRDGPDHGSLARALGERYLDDERILTVIELHDHGFRVYRAFRNNRRDYRRRLAELVATVREADGLELYLAFVRCDSLTRGKSPNFYHWFEQALGEGDGR